MTMTDAHYEIKRIERAARRLERRIARVVGARNAAMESIDAFLLACARVDLLSKELDRAVTRNDGAKVLEIAAQLKAALAERSTRARQEAKLNARLERLLGRVKAERRAEEVQEAVNG